MGVANITADAVALQERDEFRALGWLKLIAPAKVNLHLAIGQQRSDGYHAVETIMHAVNLHDVVYVRRKLPDADDPMTPTTHMVACGDVVPPDVASEDNLATRGILALAADLGRADAGIEVRIEKNVPAEGGLGGGSSDAAAALVGAARLWGLSDDDPAIERTARALGSDIAFFLRGGCSYYTGKGDEFVRALEPSKRAVALVKPTGGVSTGKAYRAFDDDQRLASAEIAEAARQAERADDVALFNNLAWAAESIMPELAEIRAWLESRDEVDASLLCGSGATTFAVCDNFSAACAVVAAARERGMWARATSFGSARVLVVS